MISNANPDRRRGHLGGNELVSIDTFAQRMTAAAEAREMLGSDIVIIAHEDALQTDNFDEAVRRLRAAIAAGADVVCLPRRYADLGMQAYLLKLINPGTTLREEARKVCEVLAPTPVLLNLVEHGATP